MHRESFDVEVRREELMSFVHQLSTRLLATSPRAALRSAAAAASAEPQQLQLHQQQTQPTAQRAAAQPPATLTASAQGSGSPQASQLRAHVGPMQLSSPPVLQHPQPQLPSSSQLSQLSPPGSPSLGAKRATAAATVAAHPPAAASPPAHQPQQPQLPGFLVPATPMFPDVFRPGRISLAEIAATEPVESKDAIQRIVYAAQMPGLDHDGATSGWLLSVAQHTMHLWKCTAPSAAADGGGGAAASYVPVELRHTRVVDERILSTDVAESSRYLIAGTGSAGGKSQVSGMTLYSIVGESFLEPRGRILTQLDPAHVLSLDQLRGAVATSVCCSQKTHIYIFDIRGPSGAPKASWKAHETDVTHLRRNVALGCVASGAWRGEVAFWDMRKPPTKPSSVFVKHQRTVTGIELSGQSFMMTSSTDGYLNVWDVRRPQAPLHTTTPDRSPVLCVRNLANTYTFAVSTVKGLYVFDGQTNSIARVATTLPQPGFSSLQWDLNTGNLYASLQNAITTFKIAQRK